MFFLAHLQEKGESIVIIFSFILCTKKISFGVTNSTLLNPNKGDKGRKTFQYAKLFTIDIWSKGSLQRFSLRML